MSNDDRRREELAASAVLLTAEVEKLGARLRESAVRITELTARNDANEEQARRNRRTARLAILGLLLDWVIFSVIGLVIHDQGQVTGCQAAYNRSFVAGLAERTDAASTEREANSIRWALLIEALRNPVPNPTPEQRRELSARWLYDLDRANQLLAQADAKRAAHPVPPPPDCE